MYRKSFRQILLASLAILLPNMGYAFNFEADLTASISSTSTGSGTVYIEGAEGGPGATSTYQQGSNELYDAGKAYDFIVTAYPEDGYTVSGWLDANDDFYSDIVGRIRQDNPITLSLHASSISGTPATYEAKAVITPATYRLFFDLNGAVGPFPDIQYSIKDVFNLPELTFGINGYRFTGWKPTSNSGNWSTTETFGDKALISGKWGEVTLQAQWELNTYTIYYDANGGSVSSDTQEYTINSTDALLTPTRDGYTFAGWEIWENDPDDGNWEFGEIADSPLDHKFGDVGLKAIWTLNNYSISYAAGDHSTGGSTSATTYVIENGFNLKSNGFTPEAGWVFDKWKVTTAGSGSDGNWTLNSTYDAGSPITAGKFGNVTMTALWKESPLADITIIVTGLEEGESAIFTVTRTDSETPITTVSITGNSSGTSSATIKSQQTGFQYQVRPINAWTWTYTMDPNGGMVIGLGKSGATFEFEATKKSSVKKNDEQVQVNWQP